MVAHLLTKLEYQIYQQIKDGNTILTGSGYFRGKIKCVLGRLIKKGLIEDAGDTWILKETGKKQCQDPK